MPRLTLAVDDGTTVILTPREADALRNMLAQQIALEDAYDPVLARAAADAAVAAPPIQDGDGVIYPIACTAARESGRRGEPHPRCRWIDDPSAGGVACTRCGRGIGPGMARHALLTSLVHGTYTP